MPFASNTNYTSAPNPIDVGQPTKVVPPDLLNGFKPEAAIAAEHVNYALNILGPDIARFTADGTWTKPTGAKVVRILLVGGGAGGMGGGVGVGGAGGQGGEIIEVIYDAADLPSTMSITIGVGGTGTTSNTNTAFAAAGNSAVVASGVNIVRALGGFSETYPELTRIGASGGAGGTAGAGTFGSHSRRGPGGAGGSVNTPGLQGSGYGSGGGGGRQASGSNSGGGGGGGGYGSGALGTAGSAATGGNGAPGICIITTWREVA